MTKTPATNEVLPNRDELIIDHVVRHRMTTNEVISKLFLPDQLPNAVTKVTARLCRQELLSKHPLYYPRSYLTLGPKAAWSRGISPRRTEALGTQTLPIEYGALAYAALAPGDQQRATSAELEESYPWLDSQLLEAPHCINESTDPQRLELIRVDLGGKPDHVARKCDGDIQARRRFREFTELLQNKAFRLVVVTFTPEKAQAIHESLNRRLWPDGLLIHLVVVPDLIHLTGRVSDGS